MEPVNKNNNSEQIFQKINPGYLNKQNIQSQNKNESPKLIENINDNNNQQNQKYNNNNFINQNNNKLNNNNNLNKNYNNKEINNNSNLIKTILIIKIII